MSGIKVLDQMLADPEATAAEVDANVLRLQTQPEQEFEFLAPALAVLGNIDQGTWRKW